MERGGDCDDDEQKCQPAGECRRRCWRRIDQAIAAAVEGVSRISNPPALVVADSYGARPVAAWIGSLSDAGRRVAVCLYSLVTRGQASIFANTSRGPARMLSRVVIPEFGESLSILDGPSVDTKCVPAG